MNMLQGYRRAGGDFQPAAFGYAAIMLMIAVIATWCATEWRQSRGAKAVGLGLLCVPLFLVCQANGWAVMGVTMADGQVKREVAATGRGVIAEKLERKRDERKDIKVARALGAIEAELNLELRRTSKQWPNGDGPAAMKLRAELANAKKADALDAEIADLAVKLGKAPAVASGAVDVAVMMALSDMVRGALRGEAVPADERTTAGGVAFWMSVLLVFLIGFFATFGPALALKPEAVDDGVENSREPRAVVPPGFSDPRYLPAPPSRTAIGMARDAGVVTGVAPATHGGAGGGATNIINVGTHPAGQRLPPRVAARRLTAG